MNDAGASADDVIGPVDYLVLELQAERSDGSLARAILDLVEAGTIAMLDVLVVKKQADGSIDAIELDALDDELRIFHGARSGLLGDDDMAELGSAIEPGTLAAVLLYENTWARPVVAAARNVGAEVVASARIPADVLIEALDELDQLGA